MTTMTLDDRTAAALRSLQEAATRKRLQVDSLLAELTSVVERSAEPISVEALLAELDELSKDTDNMPGLPADFSRADMYDGRSA